MADPKEDLKKKIEDLKGKLAKQKEAGKDPKTDPESRKLRKSLKRAQRRLRLQTPASLEDRTKRTDLFLELINKQLSDLQQGGKKTTENAYVHSLRKKVKSLNKLKKRLDRQTKKQAAKAAVSAPPAEEKK